MRRNHPTGVEGTRGIGILRGFLKSYTYPRLSEGFDKVVTFPSNMVRGPTFGSIFWDWVQSSMSVALKLKDDLLESPEASETPFETELFGVPPRAQRAPSRAAPAKQHPVSKKSSDIEVQASSYSVLMDPNTLAWASQ